MFRRPIGFANYIGVAGAVDGQLMGRPTAVAPALRLRSTFFSLALVLKCRACAKALYYKKIVYATGKSSRLGWNLIRINGRLDLPDAALGLISNPRHLRKPPPTGFQHPAAGSSTK
jgi:hypothetical protein